MLGYYDDESYHINWAAQAPNRGHGSLDSRRPTGPLRARSWGWSRQPTTAGKARRPPVPVPELSLYSSYSPLWLKRWPRHAISRCRRGPGGRWRRRRGPPSGDSRIQRYSFQPMRMGRSQRARFREAIAMRPHHPRPSGEAVVWRSGGPGEVRKRAAGGWWAHSLHHGASHGSTNAQGGGPALRFSTCLDSRSHSISPALVTPAPPSTGVSHPSNRI